MNVSDICRVIPRMRNSAQHSNVWALFYGMCVHVSARMRSFGYQIAKFYMDACMLKISFYTCICYYLLHVCSECADRLPFRSRIHDLKDHANYFLLFCFLFFFLSITLSHRFYIVLFFFHLAFYCVRK